jgi:hypothetical protein
MVVLDGVEIENEDINRRKSQTLGAGVRGRKVNR